MNGKNDKPLTQLLLLELLRLNNYKIDRMMIRRMNCFSPKVVV